MSTLIATINFTVIHTLFLVSLPVHYHPVTSVAMYAIFVNTNYYYINSSQ